MTGGRARDRSTPHQRAKIGAGILDRHVRSALDTYCDRCARDGVEPIEWLSDVVAQHVDEVAQLCQVSRDLLWATWLTLDATRRRY